MDIEELKRKILPVLRKSGVRKASLFGSWARDDAGDDSDVDILVELDDDLSLFDFIDLKLEIEDSIDKSVDLVEFSTIKSALRDRILREQVVLI